MAWRWTGDKLLSEAMPAHFTETYISYSGSIGQYNIVSGGDYGLVLCNHTGL